jgi:methylated-DNA-[protein]-cysteine S-methyltransferase
MSFQLETVKSPLGPITMAYGSEGLLALQFDEGEPPLEERLQRSHPGAVWNRVKGPSEIARALRSYFEGDLSALARLPVAARGTDFQQQVWTRLRNLNPGETTSYGALARQMGRPKAVRAVGSANALNPIALVVPCHRVLASDGSLHGYAYGLERKAWLLRHEGIRLP